MRFVDLYNTICSGAPAPAPAHERHYLQFDGVGDYAVADAVFGGISGDFTIALKAASKISAGSSDACYYAAGGPGTNQDGRDSVRTTSASSFADTLWHGLSATGAVRYNNTATGLPADTAEVVVGVRRVGVSTSVTCVAVQTAGTIYTFTDTTISGMTLPDHLAVGGRVNDALSPTANNYGNVKFIGLVLASAQVPDAELTAWLNDDTAIGNITGIDHYWCASDIVGATIPARVGTVALALSGPTSSDLVAWSP